MEGWKEQWKPKVPAVSNTCSKLSPGLRSPLSKLSPELLSLVTVWRIVSVLVHLTVCPSAALMVTSAELMFQSTSTGALVGVTVGVGVAVVEEEVVVVVVVLGASVVEEEASVVVEEEAASVTVMVPVICVGWTPQW